MLRTGPAFIFDLSNPPTARSPRRIHARFFGFPLRLVRTFVVFPMFVRFIADEGRFVGRKRFTGSPLQLLLASTVEPPRFRPTRRSALRARRLCRAPTTHRAPFALLVRH